MDQSFLHSLLVGHDSSAWPIWCVTVQNWSSIQGELTPVASAFAKAQTFEPKSGAWCLLPDEKGRIAGVLLGIDERKRPDPFAPGKLASLLPKGVYKFVNEVPFPELAALSWLLQAYRFSHYKKLPPCEAQLVIPEGVDASEVSRLAEGIILGRDLINRPANDLRPDTLEDAARNLAIHYDAKCETIIGDELLAYNFPMIHAVGRASSTSPRLIDLTWGEPYHPKVTLVGKGVTFDTGGLNLKPDNAMLLMKKDMGGAAAALASALMIMSANLPVRLRVLIPAVENAVSGNAFRPGDVLPSRNGMSVEIGNTDAEGRLVLADALALADEETPDLLVDFATLTGAARVALGPDLPPFYTDDNALAAQIATLGETVNDPVWQMPLWPAYDAWLESKTADVNHVSSGPFAGSVTAALFLKRFVTKAKAYVHFDIFGWTPTAKPGRPEGGEPQAARLVYSLVSDRYTRR